jgi:hypothetical protein
MPKRLLARWQPECIREFRASAIQRFQDAMALAGNDRRTGAIYLWGYSAEMFLKAAYFSVIGISDSDALTWAGHLLPAMDRGKNVFTIAWPNSGKGHNVRAWSELLVQERIFRSVPFPNPFALDVQRQGQRIGQLWNETLRYHKNVAYMHEVTQVRQAAEWLLVNSDLL